MCTAQGQTFDIDTLLYNGSINNRINYVILGDGYLQSQLPSFVQDAQKLTDDLFKKRPYQEYKNYFNIFCISVPSNEEGAADDPQDLIDNYFGSTFNYNGIRRLLYPMRTSRIIQVLSNHFPAYDQVILLVNDAEYGGAGGWLATASTHEQSNKIAIHELGHSFAGLADEYWAGPQFARETHNMTQETSPQEVRWKNWMGDAGIGIIAHSDDPSWKKPHNNCKMRSLGKSFCAVCRERFIRVFHQSVNIIDQYSPSINDAIKEDMDFSVELLTPQPNTLKSFWHLNGLPVDSNTNKVNISDLALRNGQNTLKYQVYDSTSYDRSSTVYVSSVIWNLSTSVEFPRGCCPAKTLENRDEVGEEDYIEEEEPEEPVVTSIEEVAQNTLALQVFPNPTQQHFNIIYTLQRPSDVTLSLFDQKGHFIEEVSFKAKQAGEHQYTIDMLNYTAGVYFIQFESAHFSEIMRIVKTP